MSDKKSKADSADEFDAWVTKYALTAGVFKVRGSIYRDDRDASKQALSLCDADRRKFSTCLFPHDAWHRTEEAAAARIKKMVALRKAALVREQAKLDVILDSLKVGSLPMAKDT